MEYKRILTIQDISCVGQCSMTVALPILSACGQETCVLPAAVLSTHTGGFGKPVVRHLTETFRDFSQHWEAAGIDFDGIYVGYLGSTAAVELVREIIRKLQGSGGKVIVDPAMADHGKLYSGLDEAYAKAMSGLCMEADVMIPNITEAAMMSGMPYRENIDEAYVRKLLEALGGREVVLTGVGFQPDETGTAVRTSGGVSFYHHRKLGKSFHGTGDMFAACFTGAWMSGKTMEDAVRIASDFTCKAIANTIENPAHWYGVKFETALPYLISRLIEG